MVFGVEAIISKGSCLSLTGKQDEGAAARRLLSFFHELPNYFCLIFQVVLSRFCPWLVKTYIPH